MNVSPEGRRTRRVVLAATILASLFAPASALAAKDDTLLVSRLGLFGAGGDDSSFDPAISADGRYVAFQSNANNLSEDDNNGFTNVFVRDTLQNTVARS